ncbi:MAG: deoxyribose-phosphate aldolase [Phycisphaerae bacterium]|nr:deoxyribose-phosphate aldolase [Phycisphaerae bacterium]
MAAISPSQLAACIDHTLLKPEATAWQIDQLCDQAVNLGCWAVCVNLFWLPRVAQRLACSNSPVKVDVPVAYPTGAIPTALKVAQVRWALDHGADEIDMVANIGALCDGQDQLVQDEIAALAEAVHTASADKLLKVILETAALTTEQKILGCRLAANAGADFVKTSTGTHPAGGATVDDVALLAKHSAGMKVKAAGGIRDAETALAMIAAGAQRIGTSATPAIISQLHQDQNDVH